MKAFVREAAQDLKTEEDVAVLTKRLRQSIYEKTLDAELNDHLGGECHEFNVSSNSRNGYTKKPFRAMMGR